MNVTQQYLLDTYRAAQHGTPYPPAPGGPSTPSLRPLLRALPRRWARATPPGRSGPTPPSSSQSSRST
ncbi:hypothetical protein [Streptomyces sp. DH12]|uniref:hypothetical protein n=1 Tax=Streptomyces sp. DH12 TaxID=2857010 RepID=UPI001E445DA6|nr:hypothetical protein [Streptomyces sp. DH12]